MIHDRRIALYYRLGSLIFTLIGLLAVMNVFAGEFNPALLMYYTIQSNLLALILFALLFFRTLKIIREDGRTGPTGYFPRFEMVVVIDILLTMFVFWVLLAPDLFSMNGSFKPFQFSSLATHLITPLLCLVDYILFTDSSHLRYVDVYLVLVYPLVYMVGSSIAGLLGYVYRVNPDGTPVRFPYFFFDFDRIGAQSLLYIGTLVVFFLLLSHGFYWVDQKVKKPVFLGSPRIF